MSSGENLPGVEAVPLEVIRTGLARMEGYLDWGAEAIGATQIEGTVSYPGDPLERKVRSLIFDPMKGVPEDESMAWLGQAVLDTKALLASLKSNPQSADQKIAGFLKEWFADTDAPAWAGKSTVERLRQLFGLFCAALEGFRDGARKAVLSVKSGNLQNSAPFA
jgi:hypothetical protein